MSIRCPEESLRSAQRVPVVCNGCGYSTTFDEHNDALDQALVSSTYLLELRQELALLERTEQFFERFPESKHRIKLSKTSRNRKELCEIRDDPVFEDALRAEPDREAIMQAGIRSILCLDGCLLNTKAEEIGVERIEVVQLIDGAGNPPAKFLRAVRLLRDLISKHPQVLVHCHAGKSRSAAVVCKYFMQEEGNSLVEAMQRISSRRRVAIMAGLQEALDFR